jgi:hypothetical protein
MAAERKVTCDTWMDGHPGPEFISLHVWLLYIAMVASASSHDRCWDRFRLHPWRFLMITGFFLLIGAGAERAPVMRNVLV